MNRCRLRPLLLDFSCYRIKPEPSSECRLVPVLDPIRLTFRDPPKNAKNLRVHAEPGGTEEDDVRGGPVQTLRTGLKPDFTASR